MHSRPSFHPSSSSRACGKSHRRAAENVEPGATSFIAAATTSLRSSPLRQLWEIREDGRVSGGTSAVSTSTSRSSYAAIASRLARITSTNSRTTIRGADVSIPVSNPHKSRTGSDQFFNLRRSGDDHVSSEARSRHPRVGKFSSPALVRISSHRQGPLSWLRRHHSAAYRQKSALAPRGSCLARFVPVQCERIASPIDRNSSAVPR